MNCESCGSTISSKMKGAIRSNTCPYCAGEIMPKLKAEQYLNLLDVLEATTFTTKVEIDIQIREKVAALLISNFVFKKLDKPTKEPDLIKIDEDSVEIPTIQNKPLPTEPLKESSAKVEIKEVRTPPPETLSEQPSKMEVSNLEEIAERSPARSLKGNKKTNYNKGTQKELSMKDFLGAQDLNQDDLDSDGTDPLEGLTPEEVKRFFPSLSTEEIVGIAASEAKGTGRGIKRL